MARKSAIDKLAVPVTAMGAFQQALQKRATTVKNSSLMMDDSAFDSIHTAITTGGHSFEDIAADLRDVAKAAKVGERHSLATITGRDVEAAYRLEEKRRRRENLAPFATTQTVASLAQEQPAAPPESPEAKVGGQQQPGGEGGEKVVPIRPARRGGGGAGGDGSQLADVHNL